MLITIEHSGNAEHNKAASHIQQLIEDEFGATVQQVVADANANIILYDEDLRPFAEFPSLPDDDFILFYVRTQYEEE